MHSADAAPQALADEGDGSVGATDAIGAVGRERRRTTTAERRRTGWRRCRRERSGSRPPFGGGGRGQRRRRACTPQPTGAQPRPRPPRCRQLQQRRCRDTRACRRQRVRARFVRPPSCVQTDKAGATRPCRRLMLRQLHQAQQRGVRGCGTPPAACWAQARLSVAYSMTHPRPKLSLVSQSSARPPQLFLIFFSQKN